MGAYITVYTRKIKRFHFNDYIMPGATSRSKKKKKGWYFATNSWREVAHESRPIGSLAGRNRPICDSGSCRPMQAEIIPKWVVEEQKSESIEAKISRKKIN